MFTNLLTQLEQDQTFYESELGGSELEGLEHEEIVKLGGIMVKRLQKFAEKGRSFADNLPPDFVNRLIDTIQCYQDLIMPPKVLGGFCPCLKPARSGPEYETKLLTAKSKMTACVFNVQAVLIEAKGEIHNMDSMHYADYVNKMNVVFNTLSDINCSGSDKALENARKKLLAGATAVDKFIQHFGDSGGKADFKAEAIRRINATQELLNNRQKNEDGAFMPLSRRVLIKAQSSLQEIMNSAAAIALTQAKDNLDSLEKLATLLKKIRDQEVGTFKKIEDDMHAHNLMELLDRLREDSDVLYSDANSKLRDALKRWTTIKNQSNPRKVAEYVEEVDQSLMRPPIPGINPDVDPQKLFQQAGKKVQAVTKIAKGAMGQTLGHAASEITGGMKKVTADAKNNLMKAAKVFTGEDLPATAPPPVPSSGAGSGPSAGPRGPPAGPRKQSSSNSTDSTGSSAPKPFNPFESLNSGGDKTAGGGTKKPPKKMVNPVDF